MRKVLFALSLGLVGAAQAQTWNVDGPFRDEFVGCSRISTGQVQCSMKSTYIGSGATYFGATYFAADSAAYAPDNKRYIATRSSIGGTDVTSRSVNVSKASPVTVTYTFDYPKNFDTIALLFIDTGMLKNVPIKAAVATPTPAASAPAPQPAQPTPPQPAAATNPALNAFDIKLTDCKLNAQGGYTCNKAELIPKR
ncbi:hypothetical protein Dxin01_01096 [Deinococcus xinjiangensis]|uniref:Uncharacterized protein n=1 Tax=Deinococcus xinjiangensis TaxID=457454 RepID=A0ABP9V7W8_9DEIO